METTELGLLRTQMEINVRYWYNRTNKFKEWMEILWLIDQLESRGMETYVSNEPQTFYNMAHFLLTRGDISHVGPLESETAIELDKRAKMDRACKYMWNKIDRARQLGGEAPFVDDLGFWLLVLGWYSIVMLFDKDTGLLTTRVWNPADVYPEYVNGRLYSCLHRYKLTEQEARIKAEANMWSYQGQSTATGEVVLDDYFEFDNNGVPRNVILINGMPVTDWITREEMRVIVAPVAGFPDRGSLTPKSKDWRQLAGRSIFQVNQGVTTAMNKWKSMVSQALRDTAQPITQEFSATPQATPEQLRERGGLFHYAVGEGGLQRVPAPTMPIELQTHLLGIDREKQKGSFNDAVYGMIEGQPGYALSLLSSSSANQILYPYMDAKHFVIATADKFWLSNLKSSHRVFEVKGQFLEKLRPADIPSDVEVVVESDVATPKDWMERATIGNMLSEHLDTDTIVHEIYRLPDTQAIKRRKNLDKMAEHPMTQTLELISSYKAHAKFLDYHGDPDQARLYRKAAQTLEAQLGAPAPGQGSPAQATEIEAARNTPEAQGRPRATSSVNPPENRGFTPEQLRRSIGRGSLRTSR